MLTQNLMASTGAVGLTSGTRWSCDYYAQGVASLRNITSYTYMSPFLCMHRQLRVNMSSLLIILIPVEDLFILCWVTSTELVSLMKQGRYTPVLINAKYAHVLHICFDIYTDFHFILPKLKILLTVGLLSNIMVVVIWGQAGGRANHCSTCYHIQ